jgi:hypothetical protein
VFGSAPQAGGKEASDGGEESNKESQEATEDEKVAARAQMGAFPVHGGVSATTGSLRDPRIGIMQRKRSPSLGVLRLDPRGAYNAEYHRLLFD